jgi:anti-sigma B factor antagonist
VTVASRRAARLRCLVFEASVLPPLGGGGGSRPLHSDAMDQFRRIQTGKTGNVHMVLFKDKKILDDTVLDEIRAELAQLIGKASGPDVLLDFSNVEFMSSAMLGLLGQLHRKISTGHGRLKMCSIRPEIFQVFKLTNLDKLFSIHKDAPAALATFT